MVQGGRARRRYARLMSTRRLSFATLAAFTLTSIAPACSRRDDDLPPPIPVAVVAPATAAPTHEPPRAPRAPAAADAPAPGPQAAAPGPARPASTEVPASTPFQIPWFPVPSGLPVAIPTSLPQIPGLPALPALPGLAGPAAPQPNAPQPQPNAPQPQPPAPQPNAPQPTVEPQGVARVTVYGTKWCGPCKRLQADLNSRGVPHEFVDVEDPKAGQTPAGQRANEIPSDMRGSVPVTRVRQRSGQTVWVRGADGARVEQAYRA